MSPHLYLCMTPTCPYYQKGLYEGPRRTWHPRTCAFCGVPLGLCSVKIELVPTEEAK